MVQNKKRILIISVICASVLAVAFIVAFGVYAYFEYTAQPSLTLKGQAQVTLKLGQEYKEAGFVGTCGSKEPADVKTEGKVNTSKAGVYTLKYSVTYSTLFGDKTAWAKRKITVTDAAEPVITAPDSVDVYEGKSPADKSFEYKAVDDNDGDITDKVVRTNSDTSILLSVTDSSGNKTQHTVKVNFIKDTTPPEIKLIGPDDLYVCVGSDFTKYGCTATDNADGDITSRVVTQGSPDMMNAGVYTVTYTVTDSAQNTFTIDRKVTVYAYANGGATSITPNGSVIYLTFDDGPYEYTAQILDILKRYDVKATFFVTNQFSGYESMIKRAYDEGHVIAAHTYSHKYSEVYASMDAYFADLDRINALIESQVGFRPKLIRFPGGSSNTVSKKYSIGLMSALTNEVQNRGYIYFDWNIDSGDCVTTDPEKIASNVNSRLKQGANVVLMHDVKKANLTSLPKIIEYAISNGYTFEVLTETSPTAHQRVYKLKIKVCLFNGRP